jgi:PAS domain S-box-containing protein
VQEKGKTRDELLRELRELREQASTLEVCEIEREEVQDELKKSEDDVHALLNATTDISFLMDKDGVILAANESAARTYHKTVQKLLGACIYDLIPASLADHARTKAHEAVDSGAPLRFEAEWKGRFLDHSLYIIMDENRQVTRIAVYVRDVTRRRQMEAKLQQAEEKYRKIYENATEGIFQATLEGRFISVNPSFARIHGYESPDELLRTVVDIGRQLWADPQRRLDMVHLVTSQGSVENFEARMRRNDGSLHWISINARAVLDGQGNVLYHEGTMRDITKRKEAEEALAESEERYRTAIEHSNDGVAIIKNGRHQYVNRRFVEMFGYDTPEEIIGKSVTIVVHPDDRERVSSMNQRRWKGEPAPSRYEFKGITRDGQAIFIEVSATGTMYRNEPVLLVYLRDVTERKMAEEALLRSHKELEQLNRVKTKAVNHVSHELKTPLAVIQGNIRVLRRKMETSALDANLKGILDALERNTERLLRIQRETDEIFRVSQEVEASVLTDEMELLRERIDRFGNVPPEVWSHWGALKEWLSQYISSSTELFQPIDLYPLVRMAVEKAKQRAAQRKLEYHVEGENDLYIYMDPRVVGEVVEGLLKNAIENTPDGGIITVTVEERENSVWIHVKDSGVGITEENQRYIFDGLFHTEETELYASRKPYDFGAGGKGLDLLRMKLYARRFGFEISMKSRRCCYIPTDQDVCPGDISFCGHCKMPGDCFDSGGSTFSVSFLAEKPGRETVVKEP